MMKKQHYMTRDERQQLEALLKAKIPVAQIARQLGFCRQTIYNEMERGAYIHTCEWWDEVRYSADKAQQLHDQNQTAKGGQLKIGNDHAYAKFLEDKMLGVQWVSGSSLLASTMKILWSRKALRGFFFLLIF